MQHRILLFLFALLLCLGTSSLNAQLTLEITDIKDVKGNMFIAIYDSEATFMNADEAAERDKIVVNSKTFSTTFVDLPAGTYAIAIFHDENNNNELDTGWFGIPKEGYGFSNDATGKMGPPSFMAASFELGEQEEKSISIKLR